MEPSPGEQQARSKAVARLVAQAVQRIAEDGDVDLGLLCMHRPDLLDSVRQATDIARRLQDINALRHGADLLHGAVLNGRYQLIQRVGSGAMGTVYRSRDMSLNREVAVKVLHGALIGDSQGTARFEREATALASIHAPSIVTVHDRGLTVDQSPFLVMELIDGVSLSDILEEGASGSKVQPPVETDWIRAAFEGEVLDERTYVRQVVRWALEVGRGLEAIHAKKVIHRDVKPSNIMIRTTGEAVLLDFGIAAVDRGDDLTYHGTSVGTPRYMAPEAVGGQSGRLPGPSLDIYGLSATLYHLLAMRAPFEGTNSEVLAERSARDVPPLGSLRRDLPRELLAIVDHGVERAPQNRYLTMGALTADLQAFLEHRPVSARPVSGWTRSMRRLRRSRRVQGAFAASVLTAMVATAIILHGAIVERGLVAGHMAWRHIPAALCFVPPASRSMADPVVRESAGAKLDALVAAPVDPVPARMLRAAFLMDQGDPKAAVQDMRWIDSEVGTSLSAALLGRFERIAADPASETRIDPGDLPAAESAIDRYLMGFSYLRVFDIPNALSHLDTPEMKGVRHARELVALIHAVPITGMPAVTKQEKGDLFAAAALVLEEVAAIDSDFNGPGAMSQHIRALMLLRQERCEAAFRVAQQSLVLGDETHVAHENAGEAAMQTRLYGQARNAWEEALRRAPTNLSLIDRLVRVDVMEERYESAYKRLGLTDLERTHDGSQLAKEATLLIETDRALQLWVAGDAGRSRDAAQRGLASVEGYPASTVEGDCLRKIADGVVRGEDAMIFEALLESLNEGALHPGRLVDVCALFPDALTPSQTAQVEQCLQNLAASLVRQSGAFDGDPEQGGARLDVRTATSDEPVRSQ